MYDYCVISKLDNLIHLGKGEETTLILLILKLILYPLSSSCCLPSLQTIKQTIIITFCSSLL